MNDERPDRRDLVLLGSTGSIGTQALDVVRANPDRFRVAALVAGGSDPRLLAAQAIEFGAPTVAVSRSTAVEDLQLALYAEAQQRGYHRGDFKLPRIIGGPDAPEQAAALPCDIVLNAIDGAAGLRATVVALQMGVTLALANKESLIIGGDLVTSLAKPGQIVPVDSEHSALAQCLRGGRVDEVRRLVLTASGGPFRGRTREQLADVSVDEALAHPTWDMGPLVTVNSATLVNKGLEVIEAHLLFDLDFDRIEVVVHPQSVVHSMVEFHDGSTIAQASPPDMRLPIALALGWPDRVPGAADGVDWTKAQSWEFEPVDHEAFPALSLAVDAGRRGGLAPAIYNAANEICVEAFLGGRLDYLGIVDTVAVVLGAEDVPSYEGRLGIDSSVEESLDRVLTADRWARDRATALIGGSAQPRGTATPTMPGGDRRP